jgi:hypothetical protein
MTEPQTTQARTMPNASEVATVSGESAATFTEHLARLQRARQSRLRSLWQMTVEERIAAMRRGDLTLEQLAAWSARHPDQVPKMGGEFEWVAIRTPEVCE